MKLIKCCQYCTKRQIGCHTECVDYNLEKDKLEEYNQKKRQEADSASHFNKYYL